jgi:hypothetical protein
MLILVIGAGRFICKAPGVADSLVPTVCSWLKNGGFWPKGDFSGRLARLCTLKKPLRGRKTAHFSHCHNPSEQG